MKARASLVVVRHLLFASSTVTDAILAAVILVYFGRDLAELDRGMAKAKPRGFVR